MVLLFYNEKKYECDVEPKARDGFFNVELQDARTSNTDVSLRLNVSTCFVVYNIWINSFSIFIVCRYLVCVVRDQDGKNENLLPIT